MTPAEFWAKADYEGGPLEAIFGYGLTADDLDDSDPELKRAVADLCAAKPLVDRVEALLGKYEDSYLLC